MARPTGDSVGPHGWRAHPTHLPPTFRRQSQVPIVTCASDRRLQVRGSRDPLLGFRESAGAAHRAPRNVPLARRQACGPRCPQPQLQGRRQRAGCGEGAPLSRSCSCSWRLSQQVLRGLDFLTGAWVTTSLAAGDPSDLHPCGSALGVRGGGGEGGDRPLPPPTTQGVSWGPAPAPRCGPEAASLT